MPDFETVEDTLFVPMLGRIYISENFPNILKDEKALELKSKLPKNIKGQDTQTQYTYIASAVRSTNMDLLIRDFIKRNPNGVIAMLGAGLETTYYRNKTENNTWYEIDLPDVIDYRKQVLGELEKDVCISGDAFSEDWIKQIREKFPNEPILVTASGLFYYFEYEKVVELFKMLKKYGNIEVVFDAVNKSGMVHMARLMKQVGHSDAAVYFYVNKIEELAKEVGCESITEDKYYAHTEKKGLKFMTKLFMWAADKGNMVRMYHLKLN